jgi:hypothetical protein
MSSEALRWRSRSETRDAKGIRASAIALQFLIGIDLAQMAKVNTQTQKPKNYS